MSATQFAGGFLCPDVCPSGSSSTISSAVKTINATVEPSAEITGILLKARTPNEMPVVSAERRIDGGGGS